MKGPRGELDFAQTMAGEHLVELVEEGVDADCEAVEPPDAVVLRVAAGLLHRIVRCGVGVVLNCRIVERLVRARPRSERPVSLTNPISIFLDILIARARTRGPC